MPTSILILPYVKGHAIIFDNVFLPHENRDRDCNEGYLIIKGNKKHWTSKRWTVQLSPKFKFLLYLIAIGHSRANWWVYFFYKGKKNKRIEIKRRGSFNTVYKSSELDNSWNDYGRCSNSETLKAPTCHRTGIQYNCRQRSPWKFVIVMCNDDWYTRLRWCPEKKST